MVFAIKDDGSFFETAILSLNEEEVEIDEFKSDPAVVDNEVFPANLTKRNGIHVLVEDNSGRNCQIEEIEALRTNRVRQDLNCVADNQRRKCNIVTGIVKEDECNKSMSRGVLPENCGLLEADGFEDVEQEHAGTGPEEKASTTKAVAEETGTDGPEEIPELEAGVDDELDLGIGDTDGVEYGVQIIRDETIATPLREKGKSDDDA